MKSVCKCRCGNISIAGIRLPKGAFPNISQPEIKHYESCRETFKIKKRATVKDNSKVLVKNRSKGCLDLRCLNCNTILRFFHNKNPTYVGIVRQHRNSSNNQLSSTVDLQLKKMKSSYSTFDVTNENIDTFLTTITKN